MSALRPANTNAATAANEHPSLGSQTGRNGRLVTPPMRAGQGNGQVISSRQSAEARVDGEASASPLRPLRESLNRVIERLIDMRAESDLAGKGTYTRPQSPRPGERI